MAIGTYKGFSVELTPDKTFKMAGSYDTYDTYEKLTAAIDRITSIKYEPIAALEINPATGTVQERVALRPTTEKSPTYVWIRSGNTRTTVGNIYADTPKNRELAVKVQRICADIQGLNQLRRSLIDSLDHVEFTPVKKKGADK